MRVSTKRKSEGLLKDLDSSTFTIATTDNIDFLQSHASVYAGSQYRSWHGTSVQVVQPQQRLKNVVGQPEVRSICPSSITTPAHDSEQFTGRLRLHHLSMDAHHCTSV